MELEPQIVHFSGHGTGEDGLVLEDGQGQAQLVSTAALAGLFHADQVQCVLLNACYSQVQGQAIAQHIPYVIGMKQAIGDIAAREFLVGFYDALAAEQDIEFAYKLGCGSLQISTIPEHLIPVLLQRKNPTEASQTQSSAADLQTLTFQTAHLIESELADPTPATPELEPFSFTIATLQHQPGPGQKQSQSWWGRRRQSAQPTPGWVIQRQPSQAYRYNEPYFAANPGSTC